jgi:hypothetical protein
MNNNIDIINIDLESEINSKNHDYYKLSKTYILSYSNVS